MLAEVKVAAFEGGQLRVLASGGKGREAVLALPLSCLLVRLVRVPAEADAIEAATPLLHAMSPFPDEPLTVSCETVREDAEGKVVIAAAMPESASAVEAIGEALDAAKLSVVRIDALALGQLRGIWSVIGEGDARRLVLLKSIDCISILVLDGDQPMEIRAILDASDLKREVMLSLLGAESFGGPRPLAEVIVVRTEGDESDESPQTTPAAETQVDPISTLSDLAPIREITVGADAALIGVGERTGDSGALNALPVSWQEMLNETRFKAKMTRYLAVAGVLWALAMGVLFGVPVAYDFMTDHQKSLSRQHSRQYSAVKEMKAKVDLIHKYSDHARGALEIMKAVSDRLPEGVTLASWDYKRDEGVRVRGDADTAEATYAFKDAMDAMAAGDEGEGEPIFGTVNLTGPNASKNRYSFNLDCQYQKDEDE